MAVPIEAAERREPPGDRGAHPSVGFHLTTEDLQMRAAYLEQAHVVVRAPLDEQAQIGGVADQRVAGVPSEEPGDRRTLADTERVLDTNEFDRGGRCGCGHGGLLDDPDRERSGAKASPIAIAPRSGRGIAGVSFV
jgi:hypothetical protein